MNKHKESKEVISRPIKSMRISEIKKEQKEEE
jgi:hypothetical protein